jgi:hypothetical protein
MATDPEAKERGLLVEFIAFVRANKRLWLIPLALLALLVVTAILLAQSGALAPFMYTPS